MPKFTQLENLRSARMTNSIATTAKREIRIVGESGLTMLKCSRLVEQFSAFTGKITISNGVISVDGRSIIDMLRLAAVSGTVLSIEIVGPEADLLMQRIAPLLASDC